MQLYATQPCFPPSFSPPPAYGPQARATVRAGDPSDPGQPLIFDATAHPLPTSVSWRHWVHGTLKTDIKNEAEKLLKTKDRNVEFSHGEAENILKIGQLQKMEGIQSHRDKVSGLHAQITPAFTPNTVHFERVAQTLEFQGVSGFSSLRALLIEVPPTCLVSPWLGQCGRARISCHGRPARARAWAMARLRLRLRHAVHTLIKDALDRNGFAVLPEPTEGPFSNPSPNKQE
jgi:hypothetical protein